MFGEEAEKGQPLILGFGGPLKKTHKYCVIVRVAQWILVRVMALVRNGPHGLQ